MAYAKINKSGCGEFHGNLKIRYDFYLEKKDSRYEEFLVSSEKSKNVFVNTPFHSHFVYFDSDVSTETIQANMLFHLKNFYAALQKDYDKTSSGLRHGWAVETRRRPLRKDSYKNYDLIKASVENALEGIEETTISAEGESGKTYPATEIDIGSYGTSND